MKTVIPLLLIGFLLPVAAPAQQATLVDEIFLTDPPRIVAWNNFIRPDLSLKRQSDLGASDLDEQIKAKSKGKAFLLSALLPGLGERYVGYRKKSEVFMAAEVVLWLSYAGFNKYGDWRKQDYQVFAATYAGANIAGKSDNYFTNLGRYDNINDYNAAQLRDRNLPKYYRDVDCYYWQWDSEANRLKYKEIRRAAKRADNRATFALGAILANHLVSAIDAVWSAHKANKAAEQSSLDWNVEFGDGYVNPAVRFSFVASF
jgi:hypothetical protein